VRAVRMFQQLGAPILGIIENMSFMPLPGGGIADIFGRGGAERAAKQLQIPFLGALPLYTELRANSDAGQPEENFKANPDLRAALETVKAEDHSVLAARAGYMPSLSLDYFYGIDATHFATKTDGIWNLGSSAIASLNIPIWNWGATQSKIKQSELKREQAKRELSLTQRKLLAELKSLYAEAQTSAEIVLVTVPSLETTASSSSWPRTSGTSGSKSGTASSRFCPMALRARSSEERFYRHSGTANSRMASWRASAASSRWSEQTIR